MRARRVAPLTSAALAVVLSIAVAAVALLPAPTFYFGRNRAYRFDVPDGEYGVLYVGADPYVAFMESFQIAGTHPVITESKLRERSLWRIRIRRPVRLVNLAQSGALTGIGADARIFTARYTVSQRWGRERSENIPNPRMAFSIDPGTTLRDLRRHSSIESLRK